jgi:DNA-binding LytR/AlgR family response regulator
MGLDNYELYGCMSLKKRNFISAVNKTDQTAHTSLIRFEERREKFFWVQPGEIYFVKSADHYVKTLIKQGSDVKWMSRHSTLKELFALLPVKNFIRLNKFYLLNLDHFSHIDLTKRVLYFSDDSSTTIQHRISPFLHHLLRSNYT